MIVISGVVKVLLLSFPSGFFKEMFSNLNFHLLMSCQIWEWKRRTILLFLTPITDHTQMCHKSFSVSQSVWGSFINDVTHECYEVQSNLCTTTTLVIQKVSAVDRSSLFIGNS